MTGAALSSDLRDPDGEITGVSWKWERSEDGMTWAPIGGATSGSYTPAEADVGNYLRVTASYTDGEGSGKGAEAVSANPVREPVDHAPTFPYWENGQREVQENAPAGTAVGAPFTATDADEHKLMYFLLDEHDAGHFTVDEETGQLRTRAPLDYETKHRYSVTLAVHDSGEEHGVEDHGADSTLAVSIIVTDVDESPERLVANGQSVTGRFRANANGHSHACGLGAGRGRGVGAGVVDRSGCGIDLGVGRRLCVRPHAPEVASAGHLPAVPGKGDNQVLPVPPR